MSLPFNRDPLSGKWRHFEGLAPVDEDAPGHALHLWRVDTATSVGSYAGYASPGTPGHFSPGNPTVGQRGTIPGPDWFEDKQEELMSLALAGGITPQKGNTKQLFQAILAMGTLADNGTGGANALVVVPLVAFDALNTGTKLTIVPAAANTGAATLNVGLGNQALVRPDGSALQPADYTATTPFGVVLQGSTWHMTAWPRQRQRLTANATLYVSSGGSDSTLNGFSSASPFLTLQGAINWAQTNIDMGGFTLTVQLLTNLTAGVAVNGPLPGQAGPFALVFNGNSGAPATIGVTSTNGIAFAANYGAGFVVQNLSLSASGTSGGQGIGIGAFGAGSNVIASNVVIGACGANDIYANFGGVVTVAGPYAKSGNSPVHLGVDGGQILYQTTAVVLTLTGTPAFSTAFAKADLSGGDIQVAFGSFVGSATGPRYAVTVNASIYTNGGGASFLPGNSGGSTATGGQYV